MSYYLGRGTSWLDVRVCTQLPTFICFKSSMLTLGTSAVSETEEEERLQHSLHLLTLNTRVYVNVSTHPSWSLRCYSGRSWRSGPCRSWPAVSRWPSPCLLYPFPSCRSLSFRWEHRRCRSAKRENKWVQSEGVQLLLSVESWPSCSSLSTVSIPRAFIWSARFSAMVKNFLGSDRASTIAERQKHEYQSALYDVL